MMKQGRFKYNSSNGRYGLRASKDFTVERLEVLVDEMGTEKNGDESGRRMVSGGNALLWRFGICAGEDTRINRSMIHFGRCRTDVHKDVMPPAGRKGTFDGRYGCRKMLCVVKTAVSGESFNWKYRHVWRK